MTSSGRTIYDGFATIRANGSSTHKNKRARSSPPGGQKSVGGNGCGAMGPLWEEKTSPRKITSDAPVARRERAQWWDIATRRSRYRSCPAFSQASVISAVEQTVTSVSDRLEKLASSPDLKAAEADELRKTVVTLRKQSSVMSQSLCNGFSLPERDISCDSVDSLISSVSGNHQHHHGKRHNFHRCSEVIGDQQSPQRETVDGEQRGNTKKRSWLRNSFRRAFGRKRSKQSHTSPQGREAPPPTSPSIFSSKWRHNTLNSFRSSPSLNNCRNSLTHNPNLSINPNQLVGGGDRSSITSLRTSGVYSSDSSTMRDSAIYSASEVATMLRKSFKRCSKDSSLEVQLSEKQKELTDCQLELLNTQHQLQTKTDLIETLEAEVRSLKTENSELTSLFRERFGAAADALLTQTLSRMTLAQQKAEKPLSSKSLGKSLRVTVVETHCGLSEPMQCRTDSNSRTHIGHVTIAPKTSWQQLDNLIYSVVKDFNSQVNPSAEYSPSLPPLIPSDSSSNHIYSKLKDIADSSSESSRSSLKSSSPFSSLLFCYRLAEVVRSPSLGVPELLPYGYCVGEVEEVVLWLRGGQQRPEGENLSEKEAQALSFATNLPTEVLTRLTGELLSSRRLVVCGPPNSGKTSLCKAIAEHYVSASHSPSLYSAEEKIKLFTATRSNSFELSQLLSYPRGMNSPSVIIVDDAHCSPGLTDTLLNSLRSYSNPHTAIIVCGSKPSAYFSQLCHHLNFSCEELSPSSEPLKGLLGRILRKNLLCNEVRQRKSIPEARLIVDWLQRLLFHLNEHLSRVTEPPNRVNEQPTSYFSPTEFIGCPIVDLEDSQRWFLTTWNEKIIPVLRSFSRSSHLRYQSFSLPEQSEDPSEWVIATYPWPSLPDCGPQHLARLFPEEKRMMTSYASLSRVGSRGTEGIYAVPSIDKNAGYRTISSSTVRNHRKYSENGYSRATDGGGISVPSSMALIAPYKAPNTFMKPHNTFTQPLYNNGDSVKPLKTLPLRNGVYESNGVDSKNCKGISRSSSDDMLENTECSSSSGSVSSDPIYSTIRREEKKNGTGSKFQGAFVRIAADQRRYMNVANDGITDAIIYAGSYRNEKAKDISYELTSTFKPVETSM